MPTLSEYVWYGEIRSLLKNLKDREGPMYALLHPYGKHGIGYDQIVHSYPVASSRFGWMKR